MTTGGHIAESALSFVGTRFAHKGVTRSGMDCRGLVIASASACGVAVKNFIDYEPNPDPDVLLAAVQERCDRATWDDRMTPGAILVLRHTTTLQPKHFAISVGDGRAVHATDRGVRLARVCDEFVHSVWHLHGVEYS